ncbi:MAG: NAD(+) diphosphatase [Firmicutes bacterium]|nr:NAD(+) diphosphatase [Bacillota bacterium]
MVAIKKDYYEKVDDHIPHHPSERKRDTVMIQDIAPRVLHQEYTPVPPRDGDIVFVFRQKLVLAKKEANGTFTFPTLKELSGAFEIDPAQLQYLFRIDEDPFFLCLNAPEGDLQGFAFVPTFEIRWHSEKPPMFACMTAFHLYTWYNRARFCGHCGAPLQHAENERMLRCPSCGNQFFPAIAPAVIVGVTDGNRLLMTRYAGRDYTGWALIAGFCEIGETVEDTVRREVMEEVGVRVKNLRYVASQPWGIDSDMLVGMFCDLDGDPEIHVDEKEIHYAAWVERQDIPSMRDNHSLTGHMIDLFREGKETSY